MLECTICHGAVPLTMMIKKFPITPVSFEIHENKYAVDNLVTEGTDPQWSHFSFEITNRLVKPQ